MIGVDTNLLVRYLAQDDTTQSPLASQIIDGFTPEAPGYISQVVLVETVRVLTRSYRMSREAVAALSKLCCGRVRSLLIERMPAIWRLPPTERQRRTSPMR